MMIQLEEIYETLNDENKGLTDKAGTSNRPASGRGISRLRELLFYKKYFDSYGDDNTIRLGVEIRKTNGAILTIGSNCVVDKMQCCCLRNHIRNFTSEILSR